MHLISLSLLSSHLISPLSPSSLYHNQASPFTLHPFLIFSTKRRDTLTASTHPLLLDPASPLPASTTSLKHQLHKQCTPHKASILTTVVFDRDVSSFPASPLSIGSELILTCHVPNKWEESRKASIWLLEGYCITLVQNLYNNTITYPHYPNLLTGPKYSKRYFRKRSKLNSLLIS